MPISLNDNLRINAQKPTDDRSGVFSGGVWSPYASIAAANAAIPTIRRSAGVPIYIGSSIADMTEYQWTGGLTDDSLIPKSGNFVQFTAPVEETIPDAPVAVADDNVNSLDFTHALGDGEIIVSVNGAAYVALTTVAGWNTQTGKIDVGDVARPFGYYKARIKAATGRKASDITSSPRFKSLSELQGALMYEDLFDGDDDFDIEGRMPTVQQAGTGTWQKITGSVGSLRVLNGGVKGYPIGEPNKSKYIINHPVRNVDLRYTIGSVANPQTGAGFALWALYALSDQNNYFITHLITGETYRVVAGTPTQIGVGSGVSVAGDIIRCYLNGTSLKIYRNSTELHDIAVSATQLAGTGHGILCDGTLSPINNITSFRSAYAGAEANTTPATPTVSAENGYLDFTHSLGDTQILVSVADSAYVQLTSVPGWDHLAGKIFVGDVSKPAGHWKAKTKFAPGRNESLIVNSPAFVSTEDNNGSYLYEDTFNAADDEDINGRTPTTANVVSPQVWEHVSGSGTLAIVNNAATANPYGFTNASKSKYYINHPLRDVDLRYTIGLVSNPTTLAGFGFWAMYAYVNANNYFQSFIGTGETYKVVNGVVTQLYAGSNDLSKAGDIMRFVLSGTSLKIYRNTILLSELSVSPTELYGTAHGLLIDGAAEGNTLDKFSTFYVNTPANTTPAPPTVTANDALNTLDFAHNLGDSEVVVSINNSNTFIPMTSVSGWNGGTGKIDVGDVHRDAGYYRAKIKYANGRNESSLVSSPAFLTAAEASGTIILQDTFNSANVTDISGRTPTTVNIAPSVTWTKAAGLGSLEIFNNGVTGYPEETAGNASKSKYYLEHPTRNVDLRWTIGGLTNPGSGAGFGLWGLSAYVDESNYMLTYLVNGETYKVVGGVTTQIYAGTGVSAPGDIIRVVINGTNLKVYRNATELNSSTISASENVGTKHGILCDNANTNADRIDQFTSLYI